MKKNCLFDWAIEIKATKTNSIPISAVKPHQLAALLAVRSNNGLSHKLSDAGQERQPFDAFYFQNAKSFVIACFLKQRICFAIDPNKWEGANLNTKNEFSFQL